MKVEKLVEIIGSDFYTGIPDSQLRAFCDYLMNTYGIDQNHHIIAANEGNCTALAAGYYLATGKIPVVYMQNSGEGNMINPAVSLLNKDVYKIPAIFMIGWRGEPGVHDEPQHIYQGKVTCKLLEDIGIEYFIISKTTTDDEVERVMKEFKKKLDIGLDVAFVIRKGALEYSGDIEYKNRYLMHREEIIKHILSFSKNDPVIATTGKASRELFEARTHNEEPHDTDFLTVGSMGHCSSIALGVAVHTKNTRIWCIDGDGASLMHLGAMAVIGSICPNNLVHVVINNGAHETVGGQPTAAGSIDLSAIARACGYSMVYSVEEPAKLDAVLELVLKEKACTFIEVKSSIGARGNLGRPTVSPYENKEKFMQYLRECV